MKTLTVTDLRSKLYQVMDNVIGTGIPQEVTRGGHTLRIVLAKKKKKLDNLRPHSTIVGDPDELVNLKVWEWAEDQQASF